MLVLHNGAEEEKSSDDILLEKWGSSTVFGEAKAKKPKYKLFNNTKEVIGLLHKHVQRNSRIVFHTDVDVDGVGTTYIIKKTLERLGSTNHTLLINRDKIHGIQQKHVDYFKSNPVNLIIVTDSSSNEIELIKQFNCDVICIDHHDMLHTDYSGVCEDGKHHYVIMNNTVESVTYTTDLNWLVSNNILHYDEISDNSVEADMSCGLVVYELMRVYCKCLNMESLMDNTRLYQWAGITLFTDAINTLNERNQWYLDNTVFSNEIETNLGTMMSQINKFKATLDKSFIEYSLAPIVNKAIRAGKSNEVVDKVINHPDKICDLNVYNQLQIDAIDKATTVVDRGTGLKNSIIFSGDYIALDITNLDIHPNYSGVIASRLCNEQNKSTAVYRRLDNGIYKGSFRGRCKDIDYRKIFSDFADDIYAQGHPPAFGFEVRPEQLNDIMKLVIKAEPEGLDKPFITLGRVNKENHGVYHINSPDEFRRQGFVWKIAMGNAKVTSKDEIVVRVSAQDVVLREQKGKIYYYDVLGMTCKAFKALEGEFFDLYMEYGKEINIFIK